MSIGERLKLIRKESGLNQTEFGARINLSQTTIGLYESDNRVITDRALSQICSAFNINEEWLKTGEGEMRRATSPLFLRDSSLDATDREIIESYIRMTPTQRQFIKDWIRRIADTMLPAIPTETEKKTYGDMTPEEKKAALAREIDDETRGKTFEVSIGSNFTKNSSQVPK
jgi:Helix-turn-helix.